MNTFGFKIKTEYDYESYSIFEKHQIYLNTELFAHL